MVTLLPQRAMLFATEKHHGQKRKYTGEPYIEHPRRVVDYVKSVTVSEFAIAAAWLHDVCEDCGVTSEEIYERFGPATALLVYYLTDISKPADGPRAVRRAIDRQHMSLAPGLAHTIKLADVIDNLRNIEEAPADYARMYLDEKSLLLEVLTRGDERLQKVAKLKLAEGYMKVKP